ncbi:hypothetical protein [Nonomuraea dietziae]|uniref:Uncharacterized protein n=1 Tax=Nonomuraea dietziae TaxID=65515 RepID=A0A7W5UX94_9ACTN|nr:hypothetical protein [Nonomuraea dietziae]MBB3724694.1 hypothetical protein [Nonomuraea dietziae]
MDLVRTLPAAGADPDRESGGDSEGLPVLAPAAENAPPQAQITVRREESEGGDVRIVAEVRDDTGDLNMSRQLGTGHAEIVRLLEAGTAGPALLDRTLGCFADGTRRGDATSAPSQPPRVSGRGRSCQGGRPPHSRS